jgi:uncharacterized protein (TIGR02301 family)
MGTVPAKTAAILLAIWCGLAAPLAAQDTKATEDAAAGQPAAEEKPTPYDGRLERLSEILGAVHYLRNLCAEKEDGWRQSMQQLIELDARDEPKRRERLTAAFNRGYRSFAATYTACTEPAIVAEERYRIEGATLASEITARYGN